MTTLATKCLDALKSGVSIQKEVRTIINDYGDDAPERLAEQMGKFREAADAIIESVSEEERKPTMKRVNNVINDVSRICREELGKSIKLTSRKGGYVYNAVDYVPREPAEPKSEETTDKARIKALEKSLEAITKERDAYRKERDDLKSINSIWKDMHKDGKSMVRSLCDEHSLKDVAGWLLESKEEMS